jgi:Cu/Ag efflux pump CusA
MTVLNLSLLRTGRFAHACTCSALLALPIFSTEGCKKKPVVVLAQRSNPDEIEVTPALINRSMGRRRIVVGVNVQNRDLGGFVAELQNKVDRQVIYRLTTL